MAEPGIVKAAANTAPFAFDFGADLLRENLPAKKRSELAVVAQNRRLDLAEDVARRTIRLQASNVDMDSTLRAADALSRTKGDFMICSHHDTASGQTEIVVRRHHPLIYVVLAVAGVILLVWIMSLHS